MVRVCVRTFRKSAVGRCAADPCVFVQEAVLYEAPMDIDLDLTEIDNADVVLVNSYFTSNDVVLHVTAFELEECRLLLAETLSDNMRIIVVDADNTILCSGPDAKAFVTHDQGHLIVDCVKEHDSIALLAYNVDATIPDSNDDEFAATLQLYLPHETEGCTCNTDLVGFRLVLASEHMEMQCDYKATKATMDRIGQWFVDFAYRAWYAKA
jgi:hypothetical protein